MKTSKGGYIYFYSSKYPINVALFNGHIFGNWYEFVKTSKTTGTRVTIDGDGNVIRN